jgi:hypothetical protein
MEGVLGKVNTVLGREVGSFRDRVGTNLAGIRHLNERFLNHVAFPSQNYLPVKQDLRWTLL